MSKFNQQQIQKKCLAIVKGQNALNFTVIVSELTKLAKDVIA